MLVKEWARLEGLHPQTVWKWCRQGTMPVPVEQTPTGMWLIHDPKYENQPAAPTANGRTVCYARVSSSDQKDDLQIEVEDAEDGGVLLTIIDSARLSLSLPRRTARELLDAIDACMKTGERQTTDSVDVWRTADDLPLFGMHVEVDGTSWTCGAVRSWDVDGLADELEALLE